MMPFKARQTLADYQRFLHQKSTKFGPVSFLQRCLADSSINIARLSPLVFFLDKVVYQTNIQQISSKIEQTKTAKPRLLSQWDLSHPNEPVHLFPCAPTRHSGPWSAPLSARQDWQRPGNHARSPATGDPPAAH